MTRRFITFGGRGITTNQFSVNLTIMSINHWQIIGFGTYLNIECHLFCFKMLVETMECF